MTFLVAMVPVLELRGAIPAGNLLPAPLVMLLARRMFDWLRDARFFGPRIA